MGLLKLMADAAADQLDMFRAGLRADEGELLASPARHHVGVAHASAEGSGDLHQRLISHIVSPAVVDALEMVDIGDQYESGDEQSGAGGRFRAP